MNNNTNINDDISNCLYDIVLESWHEEDCDSLKAFANQDVNISCTCMDRKHYNMANLLAIATDLLHRKLGGGV